MDMQASQQNIESQINSLQEHLSTIEQHLEKVITENKRLRDVVHLAESELRKRRDRVQNLEEKLETLQPNPHIDDAENSTHHSEPS